MQIQQGQARQATVPTTPEGHFNQKPPVIAAFSLTIAILALWLAYLPAITSAVWTNPSISSALSYTINYAGKGDRLAVVIRFSDRWSPVETIGKNQDANPRTSRITEGCESAFSRLVKSGNFSIRCVASVFSSAMPA